MHILAFKENEWSFNTITILPHACILLFRIRDKSTNDNYFKLL